MISRRKSSFAALRDIDLSSIDSHQRAVRFFILPGVLVLHGSFCVYGLDVIDVVGTQPRDRFSSAEIARWTSFFTMSSYSCLRLASSSRKPFRCSSDLISE